jgi:hypothetical protein
VPGYGSTGAILTETDLDERRGSILVRHGKNDRPRQVGMDAWGWTALGPWLFERATLPVGPLSCVIAGPSSAAPDGGNSAASDVSLARFGLHIIRAMQASGARDETAECVANQQSDALRKQECGV